MKKWIKNWPEDMDVDSYITLILRRILAARKSEMPNLGDPQITIWGSGSPPGRGRRRVIAGRALHCGAGSPTPIEMVGLSLGNSHLRIVSSSDSGSDMQPAVGPPVETCRNMALPAPAITGVNPLSPSDSPDAVNGTSQESSQLQEMRVVHYPSTPRSQRPQM